MLYKICYKLWLFERPILLKLSYQTSEMSLYMVLEIRYRGFGKF